VAVYDVDENLTTVLLIVVHTCFYVSFASIDIGLGLVTAGLDYNSATYR